MLRIALPNKGRLADDTLELLELAGLAPEGRHDRALQATLGGGAFHALFVRANDIPEFVADGAADVGITGGDLVAESGRDVCTLLEGGGPLALGLLPVGPVGTVGIAERFGGLVAPLHLFVDDLQDVVVGQLLGFLPGDGAQARWASIWNVAMW